MASGGFFGVERIPHVNGALFDDAETVDLTAKELWLLVQAARLDWSAIDPSIFGTLFERGLDPAKRAQLGAHYTSREDIETLVEPVVMAPLRREWEETKALAARLLASGSKKECAPEKKLAGAALKKARVEAELFLVRFLERLESVKVLDPACGSGNFLYVTLRKLKDLESEVYDFFLDRGLNAPLRLGVGPWQLYGIEINPYAHELAQMTVWIGYLQWLRQHGTTTWKEPILQAMSNIECKDAILDLTDPGNPKEPEWPKVDYIVSNPPFLGSQLMRRELGDDYVVKLRALHGDRLPGQSDLCCYWFEKVRGSIEGGRALRASLLATQGIRGGGNRRVLDRIKSSGDIFRAWSDREWILDGAAVHVSMVGFDHGREGSHFLNGVAVSAINADLTAGAQLGSASRLQSNLKLAFQGPVKVGKFEIADDTSLQMMCAPNPNLRPNSDAIVPWVNGLDITRRSRHLWIIDFGDLTEEVAARYELPFGHQAAVVKPERTRNPDSGRREFWWRLGRSGESWKSASADLERALFPARVSKHRMFTWAPLPTLPDTQVVAIALETDSVLGILQSRAHETWSLAQGTQLREKESGFRCTPTTCFETFPFPSMNASQEARIPEAARELDELRRAWLDLWRDPEGVTVNMRARMTRFWGDES